jgi:hypothetical protein
MKPVTPSTSLILPQSRFDFFTLTLIIRLIKFINICYFNFFYINIDYLIFFITLIILNKISGLN